MTPQAGRAPALPVFLDSSCPPLPRSSVPAWTTMVRYESQLACMSRDGRITYANDALGANELDQLVLDAALGVALAVGLEVAEITDVTLLVAGGAVGLVVRVDWRESACVHDSRRRVLCAAKRSFRTYSEVRQRCSRWCCHRRRGRACHAQRWRRGR